MTSSLVTMAPYTKAGQVSRIEDSYVNPATFAYDLLGRKILVTDPRSNMMKFTYDEVGNLTETLSTELDSDGFTERVYRVRNEYDALSRLTNTIVDPDAIGTVGLKLETQFEYDARGNQTAIVDPEGHRTEKIYNEANQVTESRLCIAGQVSCSTAFEERVKYVYDINGLLFSQEDGNLHGQSNQGFITQFWYDQFDRRVYTRLPDNVDDGFTGVAWEHDRGGRVTKVRRQKKLKKQSASYDSDTHLDPYNDPGHGCAQNDPDCIYENISYDNLGRVISKAFADNDIQDERAGSTLQTFKYDGLSRVVRTFDNNGDATFNGGAGADPTIDDVTVTRTYDTLSRLVWERQKIGGTEREVGCPSYDKNGNRLRLNYPSGFGVDFLPDALNRLSQVAVGGTTVANYSYSGPSLVEKREYGNGTVLDLQAGGWGYDGAKRITRVKHVLNQTTAIVDLGYGYDQDSLRLFERRLHEGADGSGNYLGQRYDYTFQGGARSAHRLEDFRDGRLNASGGFAGNQTQRNTMTYDTEGNWSGLNITGAGGGGPWSNSLIGGSGQVGYGMNQYSTFKGSAWSYTFTGALTSDGTQDYLYDRLDRLIQVKQSGNIVAKYTYDAENRRVEKRTYNLMGLATDTRYVYDGWRVLDEFATGSPLSPPQQRYIWANGADKLLAFERNVAGVWVRYFVHSDALGSIRAMTNNPVVAGTQQVQATFRFGSFGQLLTTGSEIGPLNVCSSTDCPMPYRYTGQRFDPESGLYYYKNRYYRPDAGRFITRDPAGAIDGMNLYRYARNAVTSVTDPLGLRARLLDDTIKANAEHFTASDDEAERMDREQQGAIESKARADRTTQDIATAVATATGGGATPSTKSTSPTTAKPIVTVYVNFSGSGFNSDQQDKILAQIQKQFKYAAFSLDATSNMASITNSSGSIDTSKLSALDLYLAFDPSSAMTPHGKNVGADTNDRTGESTLYLGTFAGKTIGNREELIGDVIAHEAGHRILRGVADEHAFVGLMGNRDRWLKWIRGPTKGTVNYMGSSFSDSTLTDFERSCVQAGTCMTR